MDIVKEACCLHQTQQLVPSFLKGTSLILGVSKHGSCHPLEFYLVLTRTKPLGLNRSSPV